MGRMLEVVKGDSIMPYVLEVGAGPWSASLAAIAMLQLMLNIS
jgi:hypothetical protein